MKVFLDTMVWLHFQPIEDIDPRILAPGTPITVVIPRITVRELDKHKNTHRSSKTRERARRVLQLVDAGQSLKNGIGLEFWPRHPEISFEKYGLNKESGDDLFIASVLDYSAQHPSEPVVVFTDDTGLRLTAKPLGIDARPFPEGHRLEPELDAAEKEIRDLKAEVARLKSTRPILSCEWQEGGTILNIELEPPLQFSEERLTAALAAVRKKYAPRTPPSRDLPSGILARAMVDIGAIPPEEEYERFNREAAEYLREYEQWMRDGFQYLLADALRREIAIVIHNRGTVPAEDVDVWLHFPDGCTLFEEAPEGPAEPSPPEEPMSHHNLLSRQFRDVVIPPSYRNFDHLISPVSRSTFSLRKTNSYEIEEHFDRVKHGHVATLSKFYLAFDSFEAARSFQVDYRISAANLPAPLEGVLHVKVTKGNGTTSKEPVTQ